MWGRWGTINLEDPKVCVTKIGLRVGGTQCVQRIWLSLRCTSTHLPACPFSVPLPPFFWSFTLSLCSSSKPHCHFHFFFSLSPSLLSFSSLSQSIHAFSTPSRFLPALSVLPPGRRHHFPAAFYLFFVCVDLSLSHPCSLCSFTWSLLLFRCLLFLFFFLSLPPLASSPPFRQPRYRVFCLFVFPLSHFSPFPTSFYLFRQLLHHHPLIPLAGPRHGISTCASSRGLRPSEPLQPGAH